MARYLDYYFTYYDLCMLLEFVERIKFGSDRYKQHLVGQLTKARDEYFDSEEV